MPLLADLFLTFARIGLFTFGGGYAMIAMISDACVQKKCWITHDEMMNVTVIAESTPGPIAINAATYVGYRQAGVAGAIAATLGIVLPSFAIIYAVSLFLDGVLSSAVLAHAMRGVRIGVGLLILGAARTMIEKMPKRRMPRAIMIVSCALMLLINAFSLRISTIALMLCAGAVSLAVFLAQGAPDGKGGAGK